MPVNFTDSTIRLPAITLVSGCARTGTSLVGRLVSTFPNTVYEYEPSMLSSLIGQMNVIESKTLKSLWDSYIVWESVIPSLAGRRLNLHPLDESSALRYLSDGEIARRHSKSWTQAELLPLVPDQHVCLKLPDISPLLADLNELLGVGTRIVLTGRSPLPTIRSLVGRRWFDDSLDPRLIWQCRWQEGAPVPFWVPQERIHEFHRASAVGKASLYYLAMHESSAAYQDALHVPFEQLLSNPEEVCDAVANFLGLQPTEMTRNVIQSIEQDRNSGGDDLRRDIPKSLLNELYDVWSSWPGLWMNGI